MSNTNVIRATLETATALHERRMWTRFTNFDCFGVRLPDRDELLLGCVMGEAGEEYGLMLLRGPEAVAHFNAMIDDGEEQQDAFASADVMGFSMDRFGDLGPEAKTVFRKAGQRPHHGVQVPGFIVKRPKRRSRSPNAEEWSLLRRVLAGVLRADREGLLEPTDFDDPAGVCVITLTGDAEKPAVSVDREVLWHEDEGPWESTLAGPGVFAASGIDLSGLDRIDARWVVAAAPLPMGVEDDDRSMWMLLIVDAGAGMTHDAVPYFSDDVDVPIQRLQSTMQQYGVPREIVFTNRSLLDTIAPAIENRGVACRHEPDNPAIDDAMDHLLSYLERAIATGVDFDEGSDADKGWDFLQGRDLDEGWEQDSQLPARDDLAAWKAADERLVMRFAHHLVHGERARSSRALKRYFNDDDCDYLMEEHEERGVVPCYSGWCVLDYRPTKKSKTRAEIMLEEGLPRTQATLLQSRLDAYPSLHRIAACDPEAGTLDLEDVLVGGTSTIHDRLLSQCADPGMFLAGRVFPAGGFYFLEPIGPPLGPGMGADAVEFLRRKKLDFTPAGLRRGAHKLGWLWAWLDDELASYQPPVLRNTDDEDMLFHTASYAVADRNALRKTLEQRKDVDYDRNADEYVWSNETGKGAERLGGPVTLARIQTIDDELIVTTNSAERFERARAWLTEIPGVGFVDVQTRDPASSDTAAPLDDQLPDEEPFEATPEMRRDIEAHITQMCMNWLDTPLPMLKGRTPREACRDEEGRAKVTTLIRTMPDPAGDFPVAAPRHAMLRELGLATAAETDVAPTPSMLEHEPDHQQPERAEPRAKVGRNEPCPCGSGKKYKKCCG